MEKERERYTYIYIYTRFAYGTIRCQVKSHKEQLEAKHSSQQSDFERDFEGKPSIIESAFEGKNMHESASEGKRSMLEQCFRALSGLRAVPSIDFERPVASNAKEACSSIDFERSVASRRPKSKLEQ